MKSYIVFGCGRFGEAVAKTLYELGYDVLAVDGDLQKIQDITPYVTDAIQCDILDESALDELGVSNFDVAVIAIGANLEASIISTIYAKEQGVKKVVAKATSGLQGTVLEKLGVDMVIYPEREMGTRLAHILASNSIIDYAYSSNDYGIIEIVIPEKWIGKTLSEINFRNKYKATVIAIKRNGKFIITPVSDEKFLEGDNLVIMGNEKDLVVIESL